jgi:3-dehydroquinate dehydratase-1
LSVKKIEVKGRIIGGAKPNICVPLVGRNLADLLAEAEAVAGLKPDIIEWRADFFDEVKNAGKVTEALEKLRGIIPDYPVIFTCRDHTEGGFAEIESMARIALLGEVVRTKKVDIVDVELDSGWRVTNEVITEARRNGVYVILSNHDFKKTPEKEQIIGTLLRQQEAGADIAKVAVMPNQPQDVLNLLEATLFFSENHARIPVVSMSMSGLGVISRIAGSIFGSAITFAAGKAASAPGQIPVAKLRGAIEVLLDSM